MCDPPHAMILASVKNVQVKGSNSNWETLNNVWGASWETGQVPATPLDFRIQDDQGVDVSPNFPCSSIMHEAANVYAAKGNLAAV